MAEPYHALEDAVARAHEFSVGVAGVLRLGVPALNLYGPRLRATIAAFEEQFAASKVELVETGLGAGYMERFRRGEEADILVVYLPLDEPDIETGPVISLDPRLVAVPTDHPLASREAISVEDLAHALHHNGDGVRTQVDC